MLGGINFLATIHNMRAKGMTWGRLPLFVWAQEVTAALVVLASPFLAAGLAMNLLDRQIGTNFFDPVNGGSALLYQFVFWFYSHPAVYIMILPAFGIISEIIPVFSRKPMFGYKAMAASIAAIACSGSSSSCTTCSSPACRWWCRPSSPSRPLSSACRQG